MYVSLENRNKLILISIVIALSTISQIAGKTLANTLILSRYSTSTLPYFYFAFAFFTIGTTLITSSYQQKKPLNFPFMFKFFFLGIMVAFIFGLNWGGSYIPFIIAVMLLTFTSITSLIAASYASDIFSIQEFKQFTRIMQCSLTAGAIISGLLVRLISTPFSPVRLLVLIFITEALSILFLSQLGKYLSLPKAITPSRFKPNGISKQNVLSKYLTLMTIAAVLIGVLIDYNLKLELVRSVEQKRLADVISLIFVLTTASVLVVQIFFVDYLLNLLGSKKIIIIYPVVILMMSIITLVYFNFYTVVILAIICELLTTTVLNLSRNLYLNILPQAIKNRLRMSLNGTILPIAFILSSVVVLGLSLISNKTTISLVIVSLSCLFALYVIKVMITNYRVQLVQSLNLRRFDNELINISQVDNSDLELMLKQALGNKDPESILYGLQLLRQNESLPLLPSYSYLLSENHPKIIKEFAQLLTYKASNQEFVTEAKNAFSKFEDEDIKWNLANYLIKSDAPSLIPWIDGLAQKPTIAMQAITALIYLKQGDELQQNTALESILNWYHSQNSEEKKWFLSLLKELPLQQKEEYLIDFINQQNHGLQILAMQQLNSKSSPALIDRLVTLIGIPEVALDLTQCILKIGDPMVSRIKQTFKNTQVIPVQMSCIRILSAMKSPQAETELKNILTQSTHVVLKNLAAKYIAYRGVSLKISPLMHQFLMEQVRSEVAHYSRLKTAHTFYQNDSIKEEISSRLQFLKIRVLYYSAAIIGSVDILNSMSLLTSFYPDKNQQAIALELIDTTTKNRALSNLLLSLFLETKIRESSVIQKLEDPWLNQFIELIESNNMDSIYTLTKLRKILLFKNLAAETLQILAQCCSTRDFVKDEIIFQEGDLGDGLYIVDSGELVVTKNKIEIDVLKEGAYFGELALLADIPRFATVTALTEGVLFYIDKQDFDRITDELPEIMKSITKQVIRYLSRNAEVLIEN